MLSSNLYVDMLTISKAGPRTVAEIGCGEYRYRGLSIAISPRVAAQAQEMLYSPCYLPIATRS